MVNRPLCVLNRPIQKEEWLSWSTSMLLLINSCSVGSSILARIPPLQQQKNNVVGKITKHLVETAHFHFMIIQPMQNWAKNGDSGIHLTVSYTAASSICPFYFICDEQIAVASKRQPGVTILVLYVSIFRATSRKWGRVCRRNLCERYRRSITKYKIQNISALTFLTVNWKLAGNI